jgi:hypothetical protein
MACQHHLSQAKVRKGREVMPLALNRTGTIFKKCDMSNHRPETVKRCASATCQHTCDTPEKCSHAWTLRYSVAGKQVEKSFKDTVNESNGRTNYGSGKRLAQDFQLRLTVDKRSGDITFANHGKTGRTDFGSAVEAYISRMAVGESTKTHYFGNYRTHVKPLFGDRTLAQVANDRDGVLDLLTVTMKDKSLSVRTVTRLLIVGTCDEAVKAGKLRAHRLADIELAGNGPIKPRRAGTTCPGSARPALERRCWPNGCRRLVSVAARRIVGLRCCARISR